MFASHPNPAKMAISIHQTQLRLFFDTTTTTVAPILGGWTCVAPGPTATYYDCSNNQGINPDLTAIPPGLLNDYTALRRLYGDALVPAWTWQGRGRPPAPAPRSPATILGNRIARPSCVF